MHGYIANERDKSRTSDGIVFSYYNIHDNQDSK